MVEDNPSILAYLTALFEGTGGFQVVGAYQRGIEALEGLPDIHPEVCIVDLHLPDISGMTVIRAVREKLPETVALVLTMHDDRQSLFDALRSGAGGYLVKGASSAEIVSAVKMAAAGGAPMTGPVARFVVEEFHRGSMPRNAPSLTPREREVLRGISCGLSKTALAGELSVSPHTVHTHIMNVYRKLHASSREEALAKAREKKVL